jgi:hypothetical protein
MVILAVVAAVALAACGGDERPRRSLPALTAAAEAICADGAARAERLRADAQPGARGATAAREIAVTRAALRTQIGGFRRLRGPEATDAPIADLVRYLESADAGLAVIERAAARDDLTVDEAVRSRPAVVGRVNRASAQAADQLVALGWLGCVVLPGG